MQRLGFVDTTFCLYGTPFKKQTRFWTNMRWAPSCGLCGPGNRCEAWENGRHARAAQRGPRKIGQRYENVRRQSREVYSIPAALCDEMRRQQARLTSGARKARGRCRNRSIIFEKNPRSGPEMPAEEGWYAQGCLLQQCCSYGPSKAPHFYTPPAKKSWRAEVRLQGKLQANRGCVTLQRVLQEQFWT